jgi:hypothetical protein
MNIALINQSKKVSFKKVCTLARVIQKQVTRDFASVWKLEAGVEPFDKPSKIPKDYARITICDKLQKGLDGYHGSRKRKPFARVLANKNLSLTLSHECLELIANPYLEKTIASPSLILDQGFVKYMLEVCDPCQAERYGYVIDGTKVSDFYTPDFFDTTHSAARAYSYTKSITAPRGLLPGGILSWMNPKTGTWYQAAHFGSKPYIYTLF